MKRQGVVIAVAVLFTMIAMASYLGWQLHQAQLDRVESFASYYQVLNGYLQTTVVGLRSFSESRSATALSESVSDMQTVERMAFPLSDLAPKAMSSKWSEFLDHDWNALTKSLTRLSTQNEYFSSAGLPENDRLFLQVLLNKLTTLAKLMDAPAISQGNAPGVRIRLDELIKMDNLAGELVEIGDCYVLNGMLPDRLPTPLISWQQAEQNARELMELGTKEWKLVGKEGGTTELRQGKDYHLLHFEPTSEYQGKLKGVAAGVDRQTGRVVLRKWTTQASDDAKPLTRLELEQLALQSTAKLPGEKRVLTMFSDETAQQSVVVVPVMNKIPVLMDSVQLSFDPTTKQLSKWENYGWGSEPEDLRPNLSQATAKARLVAQLDLDTAPLLEQGLVVVRSPYTDQATLAYWFTSPVEDEQGKLNNNQYFVNAKNGKLERIGSGW